MDSSIVPSTYLVAYSVTSYAPAATKDLTGVLVIQVTGCVFTTAIDTPYGLVNSNNATWNNLVDPIVAGILVNMDPTSPTYDPSLLGL